MGSRQAHHAERTPVGGNGPSLTVMVGVVESTLEIRDAERRRYNVLVRRRGSYERPATHGFLCSRHESSLTKAVARREQGNVRAREMARGIREWSILPELARPCRRVMQNKDENQVNTGGIRSGKRKARRAQVVSGAESGRERRTRRTGDGGLKRLGAR